ncbi:MAG TPA: UvrD-helicase domain-containing protein [Symbiobacteriaceae bacterium]
MGVESHPAYPVESRRLGETLQEVRTQLAELRAKPPLNIPDLIDDSMESMLVAEMALERMRLESIRRLDIADREPYFGRLDFQEGGNPQVEQLYIGKVGVEHAASREPAVIDWRTPIASLFYNTATGGEGEVGYDAPDGRIRGALWLKRHLGVKQGLLQRIVDSQVKGAPTETEPVLDEFLQYRLEESRDNRLRDIVSTIQREQNAIIRAPLSQPLIIQGVAGSGKTTVALHRLAYLLYTFRESIVASRIVIFAPSRMFLDYISDVLPELGVDGVLQTTFADWALGELEEPISLTDPGERLAHFFAPGADPGEGADAPGRYKGSLFFTEVLDRAVHYFEAAFVPEADLVLWPGAVLKGRLIARWFREYTHYPLMTRKERVLARIKKWADDQLTPFLGSMEERDRRRAMRSAVQRYVKLWPNHTALELYRQILGAKPARGQHLAAVGHPDIPGRVIRDSLDHFKKDEVTPEDLAPLVYLKGLLRGWKEDRQLDHVVIDEAQDFSPLQLNLLRKLTRENSFTILGDLSQGIHAYQGIQHWEEFMECFSPSPVSYFTLEQSYRSTFEIMTFANAVISRVGAPAALARPVFRSGARVRVGGFPTADDLPAAIARQVAALRERKNASIAVIGRTEDDCRELHSALGEMGLDPELITPAQSSYRGGLSVMPVYLTKGLEFDAVIIAGAGKAAYRATQRDAKLLYVACTRALHELVVLYAGAPSPLVPSESLELLV